MKRRLMKKRLRQMTYESLVIDSITYDDELYRRLQRNAEIQFAGMASVQEIHDRMDIAVGKIESSVYTDGMISLSKLFHTIAFSRCIEGRIDKLGMRLNKPSRIRHKDKLFMMEKIMAITYDELQWDADFRVMEDFPKWTHEDWKRKEEQLRATLLPSDAIIWEVIEELGVNLRYCGNGEEVVESE